MTLKELVRAGAPALFFIGSVMVVPGCGDDDDGGPSAEEACSEGMKVMCGKYFNCLTAEELDFYATVIGNSVRDCTTKLTAANCNEDAVRCDAGEKYNPARAQECVDGLREFSCDDVAGNIAGTTPEPAACDLVCEQE